MKLTLRLRFHTHFGQSLCVTGDHRAFHSDETERVCPMRYVGPEFWETEIDLDPGSVPGAGLSYNYRLREEDGSVHDEWGRDRVLPRELFDLGDVLVIDSWNAPGFPENAFYTQPFRRVLLRDWQSEFVSGSPAGFTHLFRIRAPLLQAGETLCLLGSSKALGEWDPQRAVPLDRTPRDPVLSVGLDLANEPFPLEYKYGVFDCGRKAFVRFEEGPNRRIDSPTPGRRVILNDGFAVLPAGTWKGAGVAIPVFSLRSEASFGVGEFTDLKRLVDWCRAVGLKLIQILPVNDTIATHTWVDSYPYAAISAFALHPMYVNLRAIAGSRVPSFLRDLEPERAHLNALEQVDYEAVMRLKRSALERLYAEGKSATFRTKAYKAFFEENRHWLEPYAVFCLLRDRHGTADFERWGANARCTKELVSAMSAPGSPDYDAVALHYFIQFHLHTQLQDAAAYAHANGVVLKGDIAIGVARHGADTWQDPDLYHMELQAGAPPDPFADKGQNWGFPTYNWPRMTQDGFAWWKRRFAQMAHYFDAFRIDHILGFFRIWSIPAEAVEGILGRFVPALPVRSEEFTARGIELDRERFVEPFITNLVLLDLFGPAADDVKRAFLTRVHADRYAFKPEFNTQRKIERHFSSIEPTPENLKLKEALFDLVSNVILFEDPDAPGEYHFRFHMARTASFRGLDPGTRDRLVSLYNDYFFVRQDAFWREQAMQKLPVLKRVTDMLICGEDLGLVPHCVPGVMQELGLLSLEIQRMPKSPGATFSRPAEAPYLSVVTPSTHDMSTLRGWWTEDPALSQRFYNEELHLPGTAPKECSGELNGILVRQHLASPAMWSIFQLQDLLGTDEGLRRADADSERINVPANPRHYWRYRMHLTLEALIAADAFNRRLRRWVTEGGR